MNRLLTLTLLTTLVCPLGAQELDEWSRNAEAQAREFAAKIEQAGGRATPGSAYAGAAQITTTGNFGEEAPGKEFARVEMILYRDPSRAAADHENPQSDFFSANWTKLGGTDALYVRADPLRFGDAEVAGGMAMGEVLAGDSLLRVYTQTAGVPNVSGVEEAPSNADSLKESATAAYHRLVQKLGTSSSR